MPATMTDGMLAQSLRAMIREELVAVLTAQARREPLDSVRVDAAVTTPLRGVDPYSLVPFAEHVLREAAGGPLLPHAKVMAERIYALGFQHRWPPKYHDQLVRTVNSLASPSQHPEKFERVAPRTLKLR